MGNLFSKKDLKDDLILFRMTSKSMRRSAKKCEKNQKIQRGKLKKALEQKNMEGAWIYAQNVIRENKQALNFLRFSSRIDALASQLEFSIRMQEVNKAMGRTVKGVTSVLTNMRVDQIENTMEDFEKVETEL